jgi:hypothetical protein
MNSKTPFVSVAVYLSYHLHLLMAFDHVQRKKQDTYSQGGAVTGLRGISLEKRD